MLPSSEGDKSQQELEQSDWGESAYDSHLVTMIHRLRRVPLRQFSVEDLRIMIGQNIGLLYLVPLALEHLRKNPLAEGAFYPGDLLKSMLTADSAFWREY
jgi:CDI immunity proteins